MYICHNEKLTPSLTLSDFCSFSRCQQYEGMQRLISLYETEPENSERLLSCMKEVQEYGLPPKEIIAEVAPDLTLDDNGMPHLESLPECSIL
jgi:Pex19 protein family